MEPTETLTPRLGTEASMRNEVATETIAYQGLEIKSDSCLRCGPRLTDPVSQRRGMGPVCWRWSNGGVFDKYLEASEDEWAEREEFLRLGGEEDFGGHWRWALTSRDGITTVVWPARISVRWDAGRQRYEAYACVYLPTGVREDIDIIYSGLDTPTDADRLARAEALIEEFRRRAARLRQDAWALEVSLPTHSLPSQVARGLWAEANTWAEAARLLDEALGLACRGGGQR